MVRSHEVSLTVKSAQWADRYTNTARVNSRDRGGLKKNGVYNLTVRGRSELVFLRGIDEGGIITLDRDMRERLNVNEGESVDFTITKGCWLIDELRWALISSDPAYRVGAKLGVWSFILGLLGIILGAWSLYLAIR
jgi:hypothetical protein